MIGLFTRALVEKSWRKRPHGLFCLLQPHPRQYDFMPSVIYRPVLLQQQASSSRGNFPDFTFFDPEPSPELGKRKRRGRRKETASARTSAGGGSQQRHITPTKKDAPDPEFMSWAKTCLTRIADAVRPLEGSNDLRVIMAEAAAGGDVGGGCRLLLEFGIQGTYVLEIQENDQHISLVSPVSGGFSYRRDAGSGRWVGTEDGHDLEGLLVRDLLRQGCLGLPRF